MKNNFALTLYQNPQTVFTLKDLSLLFPDILYTALKNKIHYAIHTGKLRKLRRGLYAKEGFDILEAANKIYTPSYVSLETILTQAGIIFQTYSTIYLISYLTRRVTVGNLDLYYRKLKDEILHNRNGILEDSNYSKATTERAFLDAVFLYKDYHFDNLRPLQWDKVEELKNVYKSQSLNKRLKEYYNIYRETS